MKNLGKIKLTTLIAILFIYFFVNNIYAIESDTLCSLLGTVEIKGSSGDHWQIITADGSNQMRYTSARLMATIFNLNTLRRGVPDLPAKSTAKSTLSFSDRFPKSENPKRSESPILSFVFSILNSLSVARVPAPKPKAVSAPGCPCLTRCRSARLAIHSADAKPSAVQAITS